MNSQKPEITRRVPRSEYSICTICSHNRHKSFIYKSYTIIQKYKGGYIYSIINEFEKHTPPCITCNVIRVETNNHPLPADFRSPPMTDDQVMEAVDQAAWDSWPTVTTPAGVFLAGDPAANRMPAPKPAKPESLPPHMRVGNRMNY